MLELLAVLLVLFILLAVITVIGHGIWMLLALIFGGSRRRQGKIRRECVFCRRMTPVDLNRCDWCGRDLQGHLATELADLQALERQLKRFGRRGELKGTVVKSLLDRVQGYRGRLLEPPVARTPAPPVAPPRPAEEPVEAVVVEAVDEPVAPAPTPAAQTQPLPPPPQVAEVPKPPAPPRAPEVAGPKLSDAAEPRVPLPRQTVEVAGPRVPEVTSPPTPPAPRRSWGEMLAAFMEERNIRWGELVGGLLIVGSSVALVLSLWDTLKEIKYSPFFIFVTISAAVFGVGLYAHHRWKLESTSRGMLIIATLLVPLNFLTMAGFPREDRTLVTLLLELASLGLFVWLVGLAARVLVPAGRWAVVTAVMGNSAVVLLLPWLISPNSPHGSLVTAGFLPVAVFGAAAGSYFYATRAEGRFDAADAAAEFTLLGTSLFAVAVALGLFAAKAAGAANWTVALECLSVPISLVAVPIAACGMRIQGGMIRDSAFQAYRTAGTTVTLAACVLMVSAICLAWPQPLGIVAVGTINAAALMVLALRYRFPTAHIGAMAYLGLAYLSGFHWLIGNLASVRRADLSTAMFKLTTDAQSGTALGGLFVVFAILSEVFARRGYHRHGRVYMAGCGVVALIGLLLVTAHGLMEGGADALRAAILYGLYGAVSLLLVARWRRLEFSYLGLGLLAAAPIWAAWYFAQTVEPFWASLLAAEALVFGATAAILYNPLREDATFSSLVAAPESAVLADFYRVPLLHIAESLAILAAVLALSTQWTAGASVQALLWTALTAACISALYLLLAWGYRCAPRFAVHQIAAIAAVLTVTTAWLAHRGWLEYVISVELLHPRNLHAYGIGVGMLMLAYVGARITCAAAGRDVGNRWVFDRQSTGERNRFLQGRPEVDWIVRHVLVWLQFALIGLLLLPGIGQELVSSGTPNTIQRAAGGGGAWVLLIVLATVMIAAMWERWGRVELVSTLLLGATIPCLIASRLVDSLAVASALRWGLAICFVVSSIAVLDRRRLLGWCRRLGTNVDVGPDGPQIARATTLATMVGPVLALTILAALLQLTGISLNGPAAESLFESLGPSISYLVPLLLVTLGLVGHAVRERSAAYAFAAGLVVELIVILGYALSVVMAVPPRGFGIDEFVTLIQLATIAPAGWAIAWLVARRSVDVWREDAAVGRVPEGDRVQERGQEGDRHFPAAESPDLSWLVGREKEPIPVSRRLARVLMDVQLGMGIVGNLVLILVALVTLALFDSRSQDWAIAAGRPLGWVALLSVVGACVFRRILLKWALRPQLVGLVGMTVIGLLACAITAYASVFDYNPGWGYRTLMLGWATYALSVVSATWWVASVRTLPGAHGPPQALIRAAAVWVRVAGIAAVLLGIKAALWHGSWEELLWAAASISVASIAGATMAVWRRREGWAFSAAMGVNLAASLVVWYFHRNDFGDWWLRLVQANVIASSAVALVWLAVRKRLYQLRELSLGSSPLLAAQVALPVIGNLLTLIVPVIWLMHTPVGLPPRLVQLAETPGWLALLLTAAAAAWYLRQALPGNLMHVLGGLGLGAAVLVACCAANFAERPKVQWLEYHTLTIAWAVAGLLVLAIGVLGRNLRLAGDDDGQSLLPRWGFAPTATGPRVLSGRHAQGWVTLIGALTVLLAVMHSHQDQAGVWYYLGAVLSVSVTAGAVALWRRQPAYVFFSGLLLNVIGSIAWMVWGPRTFAALVQTNVLCLAVGSAVWTLLGAARAPGALHARFGGRPVAFAHLAAQFAVGLLGLVVAVGVVRDVMDLAHRDLTLLDWIALGASVAAVAMCAWDRTARFPLAGLYFLGLSATGMALLCYDLSPGQFFLWGAVCFLAGFVLVAALIGWSLPRMKPAWTALRIAHEGTRWPGHWFTPMQASLAVVAAALATWVAIDFSFDGMGSDLALFGLSGRLSSCPATLMLVGAAILMAWQTRGNARAGWQNAAMAAGVLFSSTLGWAMLDARSGTPTGDAPWLHRSVNLMVSAAMMTLLAGFGLGKVLPHGSDWIARGRRAVPAFGGLALLMLAVVLIQEAFCFTLAGTTMATWAVVIVTLALAGLVAGCLCFAVVPRWDPMNLSDRGRTAYVYAAEALAGLTCLHLGLTRPNWFDFGIIEEYWMLIVMVVAFCGAGLSELFRRRGLPVLSEPLERTALVLPIVPAIAFWFVPASDSVLGLAYASPGMWLVIGLFYGVMAVTRRSLGLGALAIVAANTGLWVLWNRQGLYFHDYPQLWLIPIAVAALAAEYLDRQRLDDTQRAAVRYLALSVIYVSSTTEFLRGIGQSIWPPLILIALSTTGVLLGILLRVRSFLYLGTTFLLVVIVRLIYYAAFEQGRMWVLWTCCIILGVAIIALFAVFEKRRNDVLAAVERFKEWHR